MLPPSASSGGDVARSEAGALEAAHRLAALEEGIEQPHVLAKAEDVAALHLDQPDDIAVRKQLAIVGGGAGGAHERTSPPTPANSCVNFA